LWKVQINNIVQHEPVSSKPDGRERFNPGGTESFLETEKILKLKKALSLRGNERWRPTGSGKCPTRQDAERRTGEEWIHKERRLPRQPSLLMSMLHFTFKVNRKG
jgi:hypothetical protein